MNLFYLWVLSKTLLCGCAPDTRRHDFSKVRSKYTINKIASLPKEVTESSGLALAQEDGELWTHNDSGSPAELYRIDRGGKLKEVRLFDNLQNKDWEDLASDQLGRLFIGDFGNNRNDRKDLTIYVLPNGWEERKEPITAGKITFRYGQQTKFPEEKRRRNYDCEAFFAYNDRLYLFSKNTAKGSRYTLLYTLPAQAGDYTLTPTDSIRLNETVTGADIRPDGRQFALLTYGKVFFFDIEEGNVDFSKPTYCFKKFKGQTEAIVYTSNTSLLITNEKGDMFELLVQ